MPLYNVTAEIRMSYVIFVPEGEDPDTVADATVSEALEEDLNTPRLDLDVNLNEIKKVKNLPDGWKDSAVPYGEDEGRTIKEIWEEEKDLRFRKKYYYPSGEPRPLPGQLALPETDVDPVPEGDDDDE